MQTHQFSALAVEENINSPRELGVPHDTWMSEGQKQGYIEITRSLLIGDHFLVLEGPTGTGKTVWAAAAANHEPVLYLAHTHALLDQAERKYSFTVLKGKHVYPCAHPDKVNRWLNDSSVQSQAKARGVREVIPMASDCHYPNMRACPFAEDCPYILAKDIALASHKMACTPQMALFNPAIIERGGIVVIDECHSVLEQILGFVETTIDEKAIRQFELDEPPYMRSGYGGQNPKTGELDGDILTGRATDEIADWAFVQKKRLEYIAEQSFMPDAGRAKRMGERLSKMVEALSGGRWFFRAGNNVLERWNRKTRRRERLAGFILKPLSARNFAGNLWRAKMLAVFMSATVSKGFADELTEKLGILSYRYRSFEHPVPEHARRVFYNGFGRMTHANLKKYPNWYMMQARKIAHWIDSLPQHYRGMVLSSSYKKIGELNTFLPRFLRDPDRIWKPPKASPGEMAKAFFEKATPGQIWVATIQGLGEGIDGRNDLLRFVVVAGVNHPNPYDAFVRARKRTDSKYMLSLVFNAVQQACGRSARSEHRDMMEPEELALFTPDDFTPEGWLKNYALLADGSALTPTSRRYYSEWFKDAIQEI